MISDFLEETLNIAVLLEINRLLAMSRGHRERVCDDLIARASRVVAGRGDALQWASPGRKAKRRSGIKIKATPSSGDVFTALACGLAAAAIIRPEGVSFGTLHWNISID